MQVALDSVHAIVAGELDMSNVDDVAASLTAACDGTRSLVLDLAAVTFLDSSGIVRLARLNNELAKAGRTLQIVPGVNTIATRILELSGMDLILTIQRHDAGPPPASGSASNGERSKD